MSDSSPTGAVFLSYAREDAAAARRIAEGLRVFGIEVWFDEDELRGGDAWDGRIREQIRRCDLFLAVVSAHTQARREGYFRREWKLATDRTHDMATGSKFIVPIVVDDTAEDAALVPDEFKRVHILRLVNGAPTTEFIETIQRALAPVASSRHAAAPPGPHGRPGKMRWWIALVGAAAVAAAIALVKPFSTGSARGGPPVVVLMDSPFADRVYDAATLKAGGTNADDLTDVLRDLPVHLIKENTSSTWHRENEIAQLQPDLVVVHRSCFYTFPAAQSEELYPVMENKLFAFLGHLGTINSRVKFVVYSRFEKDDEAARWREEAGKRFPVLAGRVDTVRVPLDRATFRHPITAQELRTLVERRLGLRLVPSSR